MGDKKDWLYGHAVIGGVPQYFSVSQLSTADPAENGCLRKWHFDKILHKERKKTRATMRGDGLHAEIEKFLKTGDRALSSLALGGLHFVQDPVKYDAEGRPDMIVEGDMAQRPGESKPKDEVEAALALQRVPLKLDGIPMLGRIDLVHARGSNKGANNVDAAFDPQGTIEVCDWKSTGSPDYIKKATDLPKLIQMAGYAEWVYAVEPSADAIRLSHGYFVERGGPSRKVTLLVHREDIEPTWEHSEGVARSIRHAAAEPDNDKVDANTAACDAYGGCSHKEYCTARMHKALASFVGQAGADKILKKRKDEETMGLIDTLNKAKQPGGLAGLGVPAGLAAPAAASTDAATERAKLEAEEVALRAAAVTRADADKLAPLLAEIEAFGTANPDLGLGTPQYTGAAAAAYGLLKGMPPGCSNVPGTGKLHEEVGSTVAEVDACVVALRGYAVSGHIKPVAVASALAGLPPPAQAAPSSAPQTMASGGLLSAETPASTAAPAPAPSTPEVVSVAAPPAPPPSKKKKSTTTLPVEPSFQGQTSSAAPSVPTADETAQPFSLFVDCQVVEGLGGLKSLNPILDGYCAELIALTGDADILCAVDKSPLAFGKWEGAIAATIREKFTGTGPHAIYTRGNRVAQVAVRVFAERVASTGGVLVVGTAS